MECKYPQVGVYPLQAQCLFLSIQGSFGGFEDHRRQSIFFCGHHQDCVPFNSERANQLAKRVVEEHYAVVKDIPNFNCFLVHRFRKQVLSSGWRLGRNEQNTCSLRSLYATALQGREKSLLELCIRGKQVSVSKCAVTLATYNMKIFGRTTASIPKPNYRQSIVQEQPKAICE